MQEELELETERLKEVNTMKEKLSSDIKRKLYRS